MSRIACTVAKLTHDTAEDGKITSKRQNRSFVDRSFLVLSVSECRRGKADALFPLGYPTILLGTHIPDRSPLFGLF